MRKSRLVILPTRRLDRIGFLLLFLSCPVLGDWGRIQPDTEASDKAIQISKEGTCGLQRDTSAKLPSLLNPDGSHQCRPSEFNDYEPIENPTFSTRRTNVRMRRISENQRLARETVERRLTERRDVRRVERNTPARDVTERTFRSRSVEPQRLSRSQSAERRNELNRRSLSLSRMETERSVRSRRDDTERLVRTRRDDTERRNSRLLLARQNREIRNERRETPARTENTRRSLRLSLNRRDSERIRENNEREVRRVALSRREDARRESAESTQRRLSLARTERDTNRRSESAERRVTRARSLERRMDRNVESRRESDVRRSVALMREVRDERSVSRRMGKDVRMERFDGMKVSRMTVEPKGFGLDEKNEEVLGGVMDWIGLKNYDAPKIGDWTTNCVIGAVTYFLTSRQVKTA